MRRPTGRDLIATTAVLGVLVPYIIYLNGAEVPFTQDPRPMAVWALAGLFVAVGAWGLPTRTSLARILAGTVFATMFIGILSLFSGLVGGNVFLAIFVASLLFLWIAETVFHQEVVSSANSRQEWRRSQPG